jgi:hypothetical protein
MDCRHRPLATALVALAFAGCSAITSFDGFVGPGAAGSTSGSGTSSGGTSSGGTSGATSSSGTTGTSGGTSWAPADSGLDGPCVIRNTGPTRGTLVNGANGGVSWLQPGSALVADGTGAIVTLSQADDDSALLVITAFGFAVPGNARIVGVRVLLVRRASVADMRDEDLRLMSDDNAIGENKARGDDLPMGAYASITYGSGTDLWGSSPLTSAVVNDPSFGVAFRAGFHGDIGSAIAEVDEIRIDVTYCE